MENSSAFTGVPGLGGILVGVSAVGATFLAAGQNWDHWVLVWIAEAFVALLTGVAFLVQKARASRFSLSRGPARRFAWSLVPPALVAAVVTVALVRVGAYESLPGLWLMLYGCGVVAGGVFSVPAVTAMGLSFLAVGCAASFVNAPDLFMGFGFGGLHMVFGEVIRRRHGG